MPTEELRKKFTNWFKKSHPQEYYFFNTIEINLQKIYSSNYLNLHDGEYAEISLNVRKTEGDKYHLAVYSLTALFLGSTCKTIMEEITDNMDAIISDRVQKELEIALKVNVWTANALNLKTAKFCDQCGQNLDIKNSRGS